jgi:hypothetical protein
MSLVRAIEGFYALFLPQEKKEGKVKHSPPTASPVGGG